MKTVYVLGFAFNERMDAVILIEKNRPKWQSGLMNGVGGKIESFDQDSHAAMAREFHEEVGIITTPESWNLYSVMKGPTFEIDCFWTILPDETIARRKSMTDEQVYLSDIDSLIIDPEQFCPNVPMLVQMARCPEISRINPIVIWYKD